MYARTAPGWTLDRLRDEGFADPIIGALAAVTKRDNESYGDFVKRAAAVPIRARCEARRHAGQLRPFPHREADNPRF